MKKVTVNVPDDKLDFFMNLMKELGIVEIKKAEIPKKHKKLFRSVLIHQTRRK